MTPTLLDLLLHLTELLKEHGNVPVETMNPDAGRQPLGLAYLDWRDAVSMETEPNGAKVLVIDSPV